MNEKWKIVKIEVAAAIEKQSRLLFSLLLDYNIARSSSVYYVVVGECISWTDKNERQAILNEKRYIV